MGTINLYKIDRERIELFDKALESKMQTASNRIIDRSNGSNEDVFDCSLYISDSKEEKNISWNWLLHSFDKEDIKMPSSPKAILVIERNYESIYAVTFGHSFFLVDKFCDKDFGFNYARKLKFEEIKTTTLTSPGLRRNKVVNTYINYNELEFNSGESFAKLKAKEVVPQDFSLYKPSLEIGTSIRFVTNTDSLDAIIDLICYIENTIMTREDQCKIPVFTKITDKEYIEELKNKLYDEIKQESTKINISELDIVGVTEIFNNNDGMFKLKYKRFENEVTILNEDIIRSFCNEYNIDFNSQVLNIRVVSYYNGESVQTNTVYDLIDYTIDSEKCLLSKGIWYRYNNDYLNYLRASLSEIDIEYHPEFDFSKAIHSEYIDAMYEIEHDHSEYHGKSEGEIKKSLIKKYYLERVFNEIQERDNGFINYDRKLTQMGSSKIEVMDLYKNHCMYAVKIGNTSAKLCYAIDQSLTALKLYKSGNIPQMPNIDKVAIWLILERKTHIEDSSGKPDFDKLDMLMLKNRLDQWKKEVRLQGFKPVIFINYYSK